MVLGIGVCRYWELTLRDVVGVEEVAEVCPGGRKAMSPPGSA